ncbi:hypothetical protein ACIGHN_27500 [Acidovorax sp. NPDC077693]|uniref:hypothetical protein n=1 Tax=unclassified Acidovorax TaxID=2684926 RepID=UPI0037C8DCF5
MHSPQNTIENYLLAKDGNRPPLLDGAFADFALLQMEVPQGAITFPPLAQGREAIAETLVRNFNRGFENVYTVCLADPPASDCEYFQCEWLVAMTEKESRAVRVGCGQYEWRFAPDSGLAQELRITIETMQSLPAADALSVMTWATAWGGPWCSKSHALASAPFIAGVRELLERLAPNSAGPT